MLRARVRREAAVAEALEAGGTPAFVINGKVQVGWGSWLGFRGQVEQELAAVNALMAKGAGVAAAAAARAKANAKDEAAFATYQTGIGAAASRAAKFKRH